jgi:hypothetical protein
MAVSRRYWQADVFWRQNLAAVSRELLILIPIVAVLAIFRKRRTRSA